MIGGEEKMEVVLLMKEKRLTVRLSENDEKKLKELKEELENSHHMEHTDSDIIRFAISYALEKYKEE